MLRHEISCGRWIASDHGIKVKELTLRDKTRKKNTHAHTLDSATQRKWKSHRKFICVMSKKKRQCQRIESKCAWALNVQSFGQSELSQIYTINQSKHPLTQAIYCCIVDVNPIGRTSNVGVNDTHLVYTRLLHASSKKSDMIRLFERLKTWFRIIP